VAGAHYERFVVVIVDPAFFVTLVAVILQQQLQSSMCEAVLEQPLFSCCPMSGYVVVRSQLDQSLGLQCSPSLSGGAVLVPGLICCFCTSNLLATCVMMMILL
jgi:hypothetical protein